MQIICNWHIHMQCLTGQDWRTHLSDEFDLLGYAVCTTVCTCTVLFDVDEGPGLVASEDVRTRGSRAYMCVRACIDRVALIALLIGAPHHLSGRRTSSTCCLALGGNKGTGIQ
jgi:hypothetical protein